MAVPIKQRVLNFVAAWNSSIINDEELLKGLHDCTPERLNKSGTNEQPANSEMLSDSSTVAKISTLPFAESDAWSEFGRYKELTRFAEGRLGQLYLANDTEIEREVIIKEIKPEFAYRVAHQLRFIREAKITDKLQHPSTPQYN